MSLLNLKWLMSMEARLGVGQKMLQLVTRMSTCSGRMPAQAAAAAAAAATACVMIGVLSTQCACS
jgi:hypothetical protein